MGIAGGFAGNGPQAKALGGVIVCALQAAIVENQSLGLPVFDKQLTVIRTGKRLPGDPFGGLQPETGGFNEIGGGKGHVQVLNLP